MPKEKNISYVCGDCDADVSPTDKKCKECGGDLTVDAELSNSGIKIAYAFGLAFLLNCFLNPDDLFNEPFFFTGYSIGLFVITYPLVLLVFFIRNKINRSAKK